MDADGAKEFAIANGLAFFETSAKEGTGVETIFRTLAATLLQKG